MNLQMETMTDNNEMNAGNGRHAAIATGKSAVAGKKTGNVNATATRTKPSTPG